MAGPTVVVSVLADTGKFKKDMDALSGVGNKFTGVLGKIAKVGGAVLLAGAVALGGFLAVSVKAAAEAERIAAQTNAVIASTQGIAGQTAATVDKLSTSLSRLSGIDDEIVQGGANILLTFTKIRGANFDKATASALDMSVALGTDLKSASLLVGKALNDPIKGVTALTRSGVQFTAQQKEQIAAMVAAGDTAGAQALILAELQTQFGGSAEAFGNTFLGAQGRALTAFENIQEAVGNAFLPALTTALGKVAEILNAVADSPAFQAVLANVAELVTGLLSGSGVGGQFAEVFRVIMAVLSPFGLVLQALAPVLPGLQDAFQGLATALGGALLSVLPAISTLLDAIVGALSGVLAAVLPTVINLVTMLAQTFARLAPLLVPIITLLAEILAGALTQLAPLIAMVAETVGTILGAALTAAEPLIAVLAEVLLEVLAACAPLIDIVIQLARPFFALLPIFGKLVGALLPPLIELLVATSPLLQLLVPILDLLTPALTFVADALAGVIDFVVEAIDVFAALISGSDDAQEKVLGFGQKIMGFFGGLQKQIAAMFTGAVTWLRQAGVNIVQGLLNGIRSMAATIGSFFLSLLPDWIVGPFKAALGIASPSKLFEYLGEMIPAGLVRGVSRWAGRVQAAGAGMANTVVTGFGVQTPLAAGAGFGGRGFAGGAGVVINLPADRVYLAKAEVGQAVSEALEEYERLRGRR